MRERSSQQGQRIRGFGGALLVLLSGLGVHCQMGPLPNDIIVKFSEGLEVSLSGKTFSAGAAPGASGAPDAATIEQATASLNARIARENPLEVASLFVDRKRPGAEKVGMDMALFFRITLPVGTPEAVGESLAADLQNNSLVEEAYVDPTPEDAGMSDPEADPGL